MIPSMSLVVNMLYIRNLIFSLGRYNKYSRELSQTPWIIDGIRKADTSVEELLAVPISKLVTAKRKEWIFRNRIYSLTFFVE
jgi:tRNA pseudouridine synthase 10